MQWGQGLLVLPQFVCVEGTVVVRGPLAMVAHRGAVVRHAAEVLLVVVLRPKFVGSPPFRVVVVPVVVISVPPVVSVAAVWVVGSLPGHVVGPVAP